MTSCLPVKNFFSVRIGSVPLTPLTPRPTLGPRSTVPRRVDNLTVLTMEVIAHRGASYEAPENTLASLRLGWAQATTCEIDVRPTSDGHILVCHDANTQRTTGIDKVIARHTLTELQRLDAGSWKDSRHASERLPSLVEVLEALPSGKSLLIEAKGNALIVPALKKELEASGKLGQCAVQSFDYPTCVAAKKTLSKVQVFFLSYLNGTTPPSPEQLIEKARSANLDGLGLQDHPMIDARFVQKIHEAALKINVWTVDASDEARRLRDCGVDGLITNRPGWICDQLKFPT